MCIWAIKCDPRVAINVKIYIIRVAIVVSSVSRSISILNKLISFEFNPTATVSAEIVHLELRVVGVHEKWHKLVVFVRFHREISVHCDIFVFDVV